MHTILINIAVIVAVAALLGCSTYNQTNTRLQTGYYEDLKVEAERERELAEDEQVELQRDLATLQAEQEMILLEEESLEKQLAKIETDLEDASRDLDRARNENRINREEYESLKAEIERLQLEQQKQVFVGGDSAAEQQELNELQKKKDALQRAIESLLAS